MKNKLMATLLKVCIIAAAIMVLFVYCVYVPLLLSVSIYDDMTYMSWLTPWKVLVYPTGLPVFAAAAIGWIVVCSIGKDKCFTHRNAKLLKTVAYLAFGDAAYFLIGNFVLWFAGMNHPGIVIVAALLCFFGAAIGIAFSALAHLTEKAAVLQDDNDLTI